MPLWHPDTCGCELQVAEDWRSAQVVFVCEHHSAENVDPLVTVWTENAFKNMAQSRVVESLPVDLRDITDFRANLTIATRGVLEKQYPEQRPDLQREIDNAVNLIAAQQFPSADLVGFGYDGSMLVINIPAELPTGDRAAIETDMAAHFGDDVRIDYYSIADRMFGTAKGA